jgi:hypothetical protein
VWEKNTGKSVYHMVKDYVICGALLAGAITINHRETSLSTHPNNTLAHQTNAAQEAGECPATKLVFVGVEMLNSLVSAALAWPLYWIAQGTMMWALFVVGHDCGHGSFSNNKLINEVCGHITHSSIMVPYRELSPTPTVPPLPRNLCGNPKEPTRSFSLGDVEPAPLQTQTLWYLSLQTTLVPKPSNLSGA